MLFTCVMVGSGDSSVELLRDGKGKGNTKTTADTWDDDGRYSGQHYEVGQACKTDVTDGWW